MATVQIKILNLNQWIIFSIQQITNFLNKVKNIEFVGEKNPWVITLNQKNIISDKIINVLNKFHQENNLLSGFLLEQINNKLFLPDNFSL